MSARIVGYRTGVKNVEFKVRTNCQAKLVVHEVVYNGYLDTRTETIDIAPNTNFVREIWVYNNYSAELSNTKDERLDTESQYKKTNVVGLTHATLH